MNLPSDTIGAVMSQIVETMYFCEPVYIGAARVEMPAIGARVRFAGDCAGELRVIVSERVATRMAADFLGVDPEEIVQAQARGIVSELANVACGAAMSAWMPAAAFCFSVPDEIPASDLGGNCAHGFSLTYKTADFAVDVDIVNSVS